MRDQILRAGSRFVSDHRIAGPSPQNSRADATCRSCVDDGLFFGAPWILAGLLSPSGLGYRHARRAALEGSVA